MFFNSLAVYGFRSTPYFFTHLAHTAKLIMQYCGVTFVDHYLYDYVNAGQPNSEVCSKNLHTMLDVYEILRIYNEPSHSFTH